MVAGAPAGLSSRARSCTTTKAKLLSPAVRGVVGLHTRDLSRNKPWNWCWSASLTRR